MCLRPGGYKRTSAQTTTFLGSEKGASKVRGTRDPLDHWGTWAPALQMDQKGPGVTVVAHRGASKVAPENTLEAVRAALVNGVDMVECDVHLTKDNEVVVIHDHSVDRTTDGRGDVRDLTLQEIRKLNASNGMAGVMCTVPTLREWVRAVREGNRIPMIEIKGKKKLGLSGFYMEAYPGLAKRVLEVTESLDCKYDCVYQVCFHFFFLISCTFFHLAAPVGANRKRVARAQCIDMA